MKLVEEERLVSALSLEGQFADEQAIRALVERQNRGEQAINGTDEFVGSGAAPAYLVVIRRPSTKTLEVPEQAAPVLHERIVRLVVAQSGELAYEYGDYGCG